MVKRRVSAVLITIGLVNLVAQLGGFLPEHWAREDRLRDVAGIHAGAERVRAGAAPYAQDGPITPDAMRIEYVYPPPLAVLASPIAGLGFADFARAWLLLTLAAFWVCAASLARLATGRLRAWEVLAAGGVLGLWPGTYRALSLGQVDPVLWVLFGLAVLFARHPAAVGGLLAASAAVKVYAVWPLTAAWIRDRRSAAMGAFASALVLAALSATVMGPAAFVGSSTTWARDILPGLGQGYYNPDNVSISFAALRVAGALGWEYGGGELPFAAKAWLFSAWVAAPGSAAFLLRRASRQVQYSATGAAAVLFSPVCWTSYLPLLLVPAAVVVRHVRS